jgi:hypothetical protein
MRLETLPIVVGAIVGIIGLALIFDASLRDGVLIAPDRRKRARAPRNHLGEGLFGAGMCAIALALVSGDLWRYTTVAMLAALVLCAAGAVLNWRYVRDMAVLSGQSARAESEPGQVARGGAVSREDGATGDAAKTTGSVATERRRAVRSR